MTLISPLRLVELHLQETNSSEISNKLMTITKFKVPTYIFFSSYSKGRNKKEVTRTRRDKTYNCYTH